MKKKCSSGRQKIPIEKIPKKSNLQVTFSKRRSGLFKKASELCTLCGVEIAIIVFSPADKAFSFGHPAVESIIHSYLTPNPSLDSSNPQLLQVHRNANIHNLNMQLTQILSQLDLEKKQAEELDRLWKTRQRQFWWEIPINELGLHELQHLMFSMEDLKNNVAKYASQMLMDQTPTTIPLPIPGPAPSPTEFGPCDVFDKKPVESYANANSSTALTFRY